MAKLAYKGQLPIFNLPVLCTGFEQILVGEVDNCRIGYSGLIRILLSISAPAVPKFSTRYNQLYLLSKAIHRKSVLHLQAAFYCIAGVNHFIAPAFYLPLIPDALPFKEAGNIAVGILECLLGAGLLFSSYRKMAANGIVVLLILFIPVHVYFLMQNSCTASLCVPWWAGYIRLMVVHPLLMVWAWKAKSIIE